jgi:hypothetical protein
MTFGVSFASSVFSADTRVTAKRFNVSEEVMVSYPGIANATLRDEDRQWQCMARPKLTYAFPWNRSWACLYTCLDLLAVSEMLE